MTNKIENKQVAVIGAGIIGVCTALKLQRQGFQVTIFDDQGVAQGASKGNAGHFATEQVFPLADSSLLPQIPQMLLDPLGPFRIRLGYLYKAIPWFSRFLLNMLPKRFEKNKQALKHLNSRSIPAYQELLEELDLQDMLRLQGSLLVSEKEDNIALKRAQDKYKAEGVNVLFLNEKELHQLEPGLSPKVKCGLLFKEVGHCVDPELFCQTLYEKFTANGGQFKQAKVHNINNNPDGAVVSYSNQEESFDSIVLAAGAWSKKLVSVLGYKVPLDTERGYHLMVPNQSQIQIPVASFERKFIMTPMQMGLRLAGTVEFAGLNAAPDEKRAFALLPHAQELLSKGVSTEGKTLPNWMGFRPSLPDSLPVLGQAPKHENIYFAFGHQHLGLTQAAITAKVITECLSKQPLCMDLRPYCISRFN